MDFFKELKNKRILYIPNPGNAGDSLIALGAIHLFDRLNLDWKLIDLNLIPEHPHLDWPYLSSNQDVIIWGGGGNLIGYYPQLFLFLRRHKKHPSEIVVLPSTVTHLPDSKYNITALLRQFGNNLSIIAREQKTYEYLNQFKFNTGILDDIAFHIDPEYYSEQKQIQGNGVGYFFREDGEQTGVNRPDDNIDLSIKYNTWESCRTLQGIKTTPRSIFKHISMYQEIHTNRLHVAIAGALLDRAVNMYDNSYWKNEEVYKQTLFKYDNVTFCK